MHSVVSREESKSAYYILNSSNNIYRRCNICGYESRGGKREMDEHIKTEHSEAIEEGIIYWVDNPYRPSFMRV